MTPGERLLARLQRRTREFAPELAREIEISFRKIAADLPISVMEEIIRTGDVEQLFAQVLDDALLEKAFSDVHRLFLNQAQDNLAFFAKDYGIAFNVLNPRIIDSIRALDIKMADTLKADVHDAVRHAVQSGLEQGINPRTVARGIRQNVMLTEKQFVWVNNFRRELETNSRAALQRSLRQGFFKKPDGSLGYRQGHAGGLGLPKRDMNMLNRILGSDERLRPEQIDRLVEAYRRRMTAWHAESVARTAALDSLKTTQHLATGEAIQQGILDPSRMMSEWVSAGDSRVRDEHAAIDGEKVQFGGTFSNGETIPGESTYNCRCVKRDFMAAKEVAA